MLYRKKFSDKLFKDPSAEYRGTPFWAWNCRMTPEKIRESVQILKHMGMGGGHIHCRTGMSIPYLSGEFMELVSFAHDELNRQGMLTWLYDEDRWPSGAAGGHVTKDERYRMRYLVFMPVQQPGGVSVGQSQVLHAVRNKKRRLLGRYSIQLERNCLSDYKLLAEGEELKEGIEVWEAYLEVSDRNPWFNNQAYLNTLDKKAVQQFLTVTHEKYWEKLEGGFGCSIPGIFTDEPQFAMKTRLGFAEERRELILPFTDDLEETFTTAYGHSLLEHLPEIFWELPDEEYSVIRYEYHDHVTERFVQAYADTLGDWCLEHGILLTGHMMEEQTLQSQTAVVGEAMRSYRGFGIPGVDILRDQREYSTVKQAQSAAHQYGKCGVLSELYGVTNWDFDFRGHKLQGDWQAALGVTVRVPHLMWTSMEGEAKRDFPASIGKQSPWYREYSVIETYFARIHTAMTSGKPLVKVAVIHPIESYWLAYGPLEQTASRCLEMESQFENLIQWLLFGLIDFDFLSESLLPELVGNESVDKGKLRVGAMSYETVIVPECLTLRSSTLDLLEKYRNVGGHIIFLGEPPRLERAIPSRRGIQLAEQCCRVASSCFRLLDVLESIRMIDVREESGQRSSDLIYQMREDIGGRWVFLAHGMKMKNSDVPSEKLLTIHFEGEWQVTEYDAMTGKHRTIYSEFNGKATKLKKIFYEHDSLLLRLEKTEDKRETYKQPEINGGKYSGGRQEAYSQSEIYERKVTDIWEKQIKNDSKTEIRYLDQVIVQTEEPNVCVLDMAEYKLDDGRWHEAEEILRLDNKLCSELGYPQRAEAYPQPWILAMEEEPIHRVTLRFCIRSEVEVEAPVIALEHPEKAQIMLNGKAVLAKPVGFYVDRSLETVKLNKLCVGNNELVLSWPYAAGKNIEAAYLLGNFDVKLLGRSIILIPVSKDKGFGDITKQGLPFYGGNLSYQMCFTAMTSEFEIWVPQYRGSLMKVWLDGKEKGNIIFSPYKIRITGVELGAHQILIRLYGNRTNTFGALHNCDRRAAIDDWMGPNAWRTKDARWSYEYQLKEMGILIAPMFISSTNPRE